MSDIAPVLFETLPAANGKAIAVATLNAEKSLNSLSLDMVRLLQPQLEAWAVDDSIACVLLRGAGDKAFCAGGDVVDLYHSIANGEGTGLAETFFSEEYVLDYAIHTYAKPFIVWGNGFVMGGGLGLMGGASHRVATETTRIAMPEVTIGLYPDVGGTYLLNNTPGNTGLFLGLTGAMINATDSVYVGFADCMIGHQYYADVLAALCAADWSGDAADTVTDVLDNFAVKSAELVPAAQVEPHMAYISEVTDKASVEEVYAAITAYEGDDKWLSKAAATLKAGCPTTVHLVDQQLKRGKDLSLADIFRMELIMSVNCAKQPNFPEGVRALLVDKDKSPKFSPATLAEVTAEYVESHFVSPWGEAHPLANLGN